MEEIIEKHTEKIKKRHPELSKEDATLIAKEFYRLAKIITMQIKSSKGTIYIEK